MARPKRPSYEWVERLALYRKRIKDVDGKYVSIYGKSESELHLKVLEAQRAIEEARKYRGNPTVKDYALNWLELETAAMKPGNRAIYENAVNIHIVPAIGHMRMQSVRPDDARSVIVALTGKSASLQSKVINVMRKMFENAVDNAIIAQNPCKKLKNTGVRAKRKHSLTSEQKKTLLEAVKGTRAETFVMLGLYTGMRREEILALRWDAVDLRGDIATATVRKALSWDHNRPIVSEELKSAAANRVIPIPIPLRDHLRNLSKSAPYVVGGEPLTQTQFKNLWRLVENRMTGPKTYKDPTSGQTVTFTREKGAKSTSGNFRYTIDFDVTPHILRHTYITDLILAGGNIKRVQYLAGHADVQVTLDYYTHLVENTPQDLWGTIAGAFEPTR